MNKESLAAYIGTLESKQKSGRRSQNDSELLSVSEMHDRDNIISL